MYLERIFVAVCFVGAATDNSYLREFRFSTVLSVKVTDLCVW